MPEKLNKQARSKLMSRVRGKNTSPEIRVRKFLHQRGFRFRLHRKDLPGKPDIVLPKFNLCIFVHGCFWHQHPGCKRATIPVNNSTFWLEKFSKNQSRDAIVSQELQKLGWQVLVIWECQTKSIDSLADIIKDILPL